MNRLENPLVAHPVRVTERIIDGQKYIVESFFSPTATETAEDKIKRLLLNDCRRGLAEKDRGND